MKKGLLLQLLYIHSHIIQAKLEGVRLATARRLRGNYALLMPLHAEKQELVADMEAKQFDEGVFAEEVKIWEEETFKKAQEIHFFEEDEFDQVKNEEVNGRMLDMWVGFLYEIQKELK